MKRGGGEAESRTVEHEAESGPETIRRRLLRMGEGSAADHVQEHPSMLYLWLLVAAEAAPAAFQQSP